MSEAFRLVGVLNNLPIQSLTVSIQFHLSTSSLLCGIFYFLRLGNYLLGIRLPTVYTCVFMRSVTHPPPHLYCLSTGRPGCLEHRLGLDIASYPGSWCP